MCFTKDGRADVQTMYNAQTDLVYIHMDDTHQSVLNRQLSDDVVVDIGEDDQIVGIEILGASKHLDLSNLLPIEYISAV